MKRTFAQGSAADRRMVLIEVEGARLTVKQKKSDGTVKRNDKDLASEAAARAAGEQMAGELLARGFVEQTAKAKASKPKPEPEDVNPPDLYGDMEETGAVEGPVLSRRTVAPSTETAPKKKKSGGKKKKKPVESGDSLDKRVLGAVGLVGVAGAVLVGYFIYDAFLKPASIAGVWVGSMIDFEIGKPIIHTKYRLVLDEQNHATMTLQEKFTSVGTYTVKDKILKLNLKAEKDEDGEEGEPVDREYKITLGRATLDLYDPSSGKQLVQLLRAFEKPSAKSAAPAAPASAPKDLIAVGTEAVDKDAEAKLASVAFAPKDEAFRLRYPQGWTSETGSRPDNTYSWATFTQGSAKIQIYADVTGSLMAGSPNAAQYEEGSELAPVHSAHERYQATIAKEFNDYKEGKPTLFKGSGLGEGRIGLFSASTGGLLGSKVRGYRVTLLTNDRRITVLCQAPTAELDKLRPTFLAVAHSLSR